MLKILFLLLASCAYGGSREQDCPVHQNEMEYADKPYRVTGELTAAQVEELKVRDILFPFGVDFTPTGCVPSGDLGLTDSPKGYICGACVYARAKWLAEQEAKE